MQTRARALADGVEPWQRGAPVEVHRDPTHHVVGGGRDRHRFRARLQAGVGQRGEDVGKAGGVDLAQVELHVGGGLGLHAVEDRRGNGVAGRQLVGEALPRRIEQRRSLAADRLRNQYAVEGRAGQGQGGGVELAELEIGQVCAGGGRQHGAGADRATGVGRPPPQRRGAAGCQHRCGGADRTGIGDHAVAAFSVAPQGRRRGALTDLDPGLCGDHRRQLRSQLVPGLAAAGVDDAPARVTSLEAQRQPAFVVEVEDDPAREQIPYRRRRFLGQHLYGQRGGRARVRRRSCRRRGWRASRRARAPRPDRPGPRSWRSARAACGRSGRRCRPARPRAARSRDPRRRRQPRRRRTRRLTAIAPQPLGESSQAARAARPPRLRAPEPSRRRRSFRPPRPGARPPRSASPPPRPRFRSRPSRSWAAAIARSFAWRSRCSSSSWASRSFSRASSASARSRSRSASRASISAFARRSAAPATSAASFSLRSASSTCALRLSSPASRVLMGSI